MRMKYVSREHQATNTAEDNLASLLCQEKASLHFYEVMSPQDTQPCRNFAQEGIAGVRKNFLFPGETEGKMGPAYQQALVQQQQPPLEEKIQ